MNFWRTFGINTVSAIETILERDDFTLEELMDEEDVIQECKSENQKLIDFIVLPSTLDKLVEYVTVEPPEEADSVRSFKYPFVACEILSSDVWSICDAIFENKKLLDKIYGFLDGKKPLNETLANHVSKVAGSLLEKKVSDTFEYLKSKDDIVSKFIDNLTTSAIMDLLLKIIASAENDSLEWLCKFNLIPRLVEKFEKSHGDETHENVASVLSDIIQVSAQTKDSPLLKQIENEETLTTLLKYMFAEGAGSSLYHGIDVLIELVKRNISDKYEDTLTIDKVPTPLAVIMNNLDKFRNLLDNEERKEIFTSACKLRPLGFKKLKIIKFCAPLFSTNYKCINEILVKSKLLDLLINLFFKYEWNNFLHAIIEQLVHSILEGKDESLKETLLIDCKLAPKIVNASKINKEAQEQPRGCRKGYMGFVTNMTLEILNVAKSNEKVSNFLANECEGWTQYVEGPFTEIRSIETSTGVEKNDSSGEDFMNSPLFEHNVEDDEEFNFEDDNQFAFGNDDWVEDPEELDSGSVDSDNDENYDNDENPKDDEPEQQDNKEQQANEEQKGDDEQVKEQNNEEQQNDENAQQDNNEEQQEDNKEQQADEEQQKDENEQQDNNEEQQEDNKDNAQDDKLSSKDNLNDDNKDNNGDNKDNSNDVKDNVGDNHVKKEQINDQNNSQDKLNQVDTKEEQNTQNVDSN